MKKSMYRDAAYDILKISKIPLSAKNLTEIAIKLALIKSTAKINGMRHALNKDINDNGKTSKFYNIDGLFDFRSRVKKEATKYIKAANEALKLVNTPFNAQEITKIAISNKFLKTSKSRKLAANFMDAVLKADIKENKGTSKFYEVENGVYGLTLWRKAGESESKNKRGKVPKYDFSKANIPSGSVFLFVRDKKITCKVVDNHHVRINDKTMLLSPAAFEAFIIWRGKGSRVQGSAYWKYKGKLLKDILGDVEKE